MVRGQTHALVDAAGFGVEPALDLYPPSGNLLHLFGHQVVEHAVAVEEVDDEAAPGGEHAGDLFEHLEILPFAFEVAEGGEEVEHPIEALGGQRQAAHVAGQTGDPRRHGEQGDREIDPQGAIAPASQRRRVTSGPTGQIEHRGGLVRPLVGQNLLYEVDVTIRLTGIAVGVELEVFLAKPFFVPGHDFRYYARIPSLMVRLGSISFQSPLILAPMAGVTDRDFRLIVRRIGGCGLVTMEFLRSRGLVEGDRRVEKQFWYCDEERPLSIQIYGSDPDTMAEAARIVEERGADVCDINMGCPANKVLKGCAGAALMGDLDLADRIVDAVRRAITIPLSVKFRLGLDDRRRNYLELGRICEARGADAVALHPRTAKQGYRGEAEWSAISELKEAVSIPVFGNGDVRQAEDAVRMLRHTGCDAVMVGRGATRNPWIFRQVEALLSGGEVPQPTWDDRRRLILDHFRTVVEREDAKLAHFKLATFTNWYSQGLPDGLSLRRQIQKLDTPEKFYAAIDDFFDRMMLAEAA